MKNTLLAVLVISLCYYDSQAQVISLQSPGYIKYQEVIPKHSIDKEADKANRITDGVTATDKLTHAISAFNKLADGTASADKLADILMNSLEVFDDGNTGGRPAPHIKPVVLKQQDIPVNDEYTYAEYMQQLLLRLHPLTKPRPINSKKSGWLL